MILSTAQVAAMNMGVSDGIFPEGIPSSYSWYAHGLGFHYPCSPPPGWTQAQIYAHVFIPDGSPNPANPPNLLMRNPQLAVRTLDKVWHQLVEPPQTVGGGHFWLPVTPDNNADPLTITPLANGVVRIQPPTPTRMSHFWPGRGDFSTWGAQIDAVFISWEAALDAPGRYCFGLAMDWWTNSQGAAPAGSFTSNQASLCAMDWGTLDNVADSSAWGNYKTFVATNLTQAQLEESLPPYFNGNKNGDGTVTTTPPPASSPGTVLLAANMAGDQGALQGTSYNIWTNGKVGGAISLPTKGTYRFDVVAHGSVAGGIWPNMNFLLDNAQVGPVTPVNTVGDKTYSFSPLASLAVGAHDVRAQFTNDGTDVSGGDRNLFITSITAILVAADIGSGTTTAPPPVTPATVNITVNGVSVNVKSGDVLTSTIKVN